MDSRLQPTRTNRQPTRCFLHRAGAGLIRGKDLRATNANQRDLRRFYAGAQAHGRAHAPRTARNAPGCNGDHRVGPRWLRWRAGVNGSSPGLCASDGPTNSRGLGFCLSRTANIPRDAFGANVGGGLAGEAPWYDPARRLATRRDCGRQGGLCGGDRQVTKGGLGWMNVSVAGAAWPGPRTRAGATSAWFSTSTTTWRTGHAAASAAGLRTGGTSTAFDAQNTTAWPITGRSSSTCPGWLGRFVRGRRFGL